MLLLRNQKSKYLVLILLFLLSLFALSCQDKQKRKFNLNKWQLSWPKWTKQVVSKNDNSNKENPSKAIVSSQFGKYFEVTVLDSSADNKCLQRIWSYIDELVPTVTNWQILHRNGIRAGVGLYSDWPALKKQLESCNTKVKTTSQIMITSFSSAKLIADDFKKTRTLFYYDNEGRFHGKDYPASQLQLMLISGGKVGNNRIRIIFAPKIFYRKTRIEQLTGKSANRKFANIESQLEKFSIIIDISKNEFALIGVSDLNLPETLIGTQLFTRWKSGQKHSLFILISPVSTSNKKGNRGLWKD